MSKLSKFVKRIVLLFAVCLLTIGLAACGNQQSYGKIKSRKTLVVGILNSNPPYEFQKEVHGHNKLEGSDVKLAHKIANAMHVKLKLKPMTLGGLLPALQSGKVDMLVTCMTPNAERRKYASFSNIYYTAKDTMAVRKNDLQRYNHNHNLFKNANIAVTNGSAQQTALEKKMPKAKLTKFTNVPDMALAVKNNKTDAFSIDVPTTKILLHQNKGLKETNFRYSDNSVGAAVLLPKHPSKKLLKVVNHVIKCNKAKYAKWVNEETTKVPKLK